MTTITVTREKLYELVWTKPVTQVAKEFGLSDVAVKKMCTRMQVPTPERGYWARLEAGQQVSKTPLPALATDAKKPEPERVNPEANAERREELQRLAILPVAPKDDTRLELPANVEIASLHRRAREACAALLKAKPDAHGRVELSSAEHPSLHVSLAGAERVARALHAIYSELEARGVELKPVKTHDRTHLGFVRGQDRVSIFIEEPLSTQRREPTPEELRRPSREWKLENTGPGGLLQVLLLGHENEWSTRRSKRNEGPKRPLEVLLREVVEWVWGFFEQQEETRRRRKAEEEAREKAEAERRQREAEERRLQAARRAEEEARRAETERREKHEAKLREAATARVENLLRAAEWWRHSRALCDYIAELEARWAAAAQGRLSEAQKHWLAWARGEAEAMSPERMGYPDPSRDVAFDPATVPPDGPYPEVPALPVPPAFRALSASSRDEPVAPRPTPPAAPPPPATPPPPASVYPAYVKPQFPYWLLHRGRR